MTKRLEGRVAVITGASRGIGRAVAKRFAEEGAHIIAIARTTGALEELDDEIQAAGGHATLVPLDMEDLDAIDRLGQAINDRWGKLDILVGNAALLGTLAPIAQIEAKEWDQLIKVNLTANWRLVQSLDPLLQKSDAARCVFVTSSVGHEPRAYWGSYAVSKAGLEMMAGIYAQETEKTNIRVNMINPGGTRTNMRAKAMPGEDPQTVKSPEDVTEYFLELCEPACVKHGELVELPKTL